MAEDHCELPPAGADTERGLTADPSLTGPRADCVRCGEPTEYPTEHPGSTLCAVCTWQQAGRIACAG